VVKDNDWFERPIFVLGAPRSGTSMVAGALGLCGAWLGQTVKGGTRENPKGYFEHEGLRDGVIKHHLRSLHCDPRGVRPLPEIGQVKPLPYLREMIRRLIYKEGYDGNTPWLFKDPKLTLVWPAWAVAFPQARWVIVRRAPDEIAYSCLKTDFMSRQSEDIAFWHKFIEAHLDRLALLKTSGVWWRELWAAPVINGDFTELRNLIEELRLQWNESAVVQFIEPLFWHAATPLSDSSGGANPRTASQQVTRSNYRNDTAHEVDNGASPAAGTQAQPTTDDRKERAEQLLQAGNFPEALAIYKAICDEHPNDPLSWMMQGIIHGQKGDLNNAERCCRTAVDLAPNSSQPHFNLAKVYELQGHREKAIASYQAALDIEPRSIAALINLGNLLNEASRYSEAEEKYRKAISVAPDNVMATYNLATLLQDHGDAAEAENLYRKIIQLQPRHAEAHYNLAILLINQNRVQDAFALLETAIEIKPDFPQAWYNRGKLLEAGQHYQEAADSFLQALRQRPDFLEAYINYSNMLFEQGRFDEALRYARTAVEVGVDSADAHNNLGILLRMQNRYDEAEASLRKALDCQPDHADAHWNLSLVLLARCDLANGWQEYEWGMRAGTRDAANPDLPLWDGRIRNGQRVLILREQGVGDEVLFVSCLPELLESGLDCVLESDARLVPLFSRSFPRANVIARKTAGETMNAFLDRAGAVDAQIAEGSLPRYFRCDSNDFPKRRSYLCADSRQIEEWKKRYGRYGNDLKVGISWRGGSKAVMRLQRSIGLLSWSGLLSNPGATFIDLQYGDTSVEREAFHSQTGLVLHHFDEVDPLQDLDGFAAQVAALDLVISIDNSTVHLSGALGVPTWVLLPYVADCRWFLERGDSPWYQSVRLIRQQSHAQWGEVFEVVTRMLNRLVQGGEQL